MNEIHEVDGIKENRATPPPAYFFILFYGLIVWAIVFSCYYLFSGWSSSGEFEQKMAEHQQLVSKQGIEAAVGGK